MLAPSSDPYLTLLYSKELLFFFPLTADRVGVLWGLRVLVLRKSISDVQPHQGGSLYSCQSFVGLFSLSPVLAWCVYVTGDGPQSPPLG